jgi:hypothetical protein
MILAFRHGVLLLKGTRARPRKTSGNVHRGLLGRQLSVFWTIFRATTGRALADFIGGFGLWVDSGGILHHTYSMLGIDTYKQSASKRFHRRREGEDAVRVLGRLNAGCRRRSGDP